METLHKGIITILKSAILQQPGQLPEDFDLEAAYPLIKRHHMATLIYDGAIRCGIDPADPKMQPLLQSYISSLSISERQLMAVSRIYAAFEENGIDYMPLKGCNMKALYPLPELRVMGDADILIRLEQYEKIIPIMEGLGFQAKAESTHELAWRSPMLYVELHKRLIPVYNKDLAPYFGDGWKLAKKTKGTRYDMSVEDEWAFQFAHFAKHYRDGGIGCRHVVDLWVYLRSHPELDQAAVRRIMEQLKLLRFYENILQLLRVWFEDAPSDDKMEYITAFIFSSGSWGLDTSRLLSRTVRDSKHNALGFSGRLLYIWQTMFPPLAALRKKYTLLNKAPWLLPFVWLIRPFYKVLFERKSLEKQGRNLSALSEEKMDARRRQLDYVGLDYNF